MDGANSLVLNGELMLYGIVDPWNDPGTTLRAIDVMASLAELGDQETIVCRLNSPGGSVQEGLAIFNALRASGKTIEMHIDAMAASVASVIAMAGDTIIMADNASIMVHDPFVMAFGGSSEELRALADEIDRMKSVILDIYSKRTGLGRPELEAMMAAETYLSAKDAVAKGFADKIEKSRKVAACAVLDPETLARLIAPPKLRAERAGPSAPADHRQENHMPEPNQAAPEIIAARAEAARMERQRITEIRAAVRGASLGDDFADELIDAGLSLDDAKVKIVARAKAPDGADIRAAAVREERERVAQIGAAVRAAKLPAEFAAELVAAHLTLAEANAKIINKLAETAENDQGNESPTRSQNRVTLDAVDKWQKGATEGLMARAGMKGGVRNEFSGLTLAELARASLDLRNIRSGAMDRLEMIGTAFTLRNAGPGYHSTSDFGNVLSSVAYKALLTGYQEAEETFEQWTGTGTASDFRPVNRVDLGLFPNLDKVIEAGEYTYATIGDSGVTVQVATYGKMFAISRQAIVNDDLDQFSKVPMKMGRAAKRTIGSLVYAVINSNPTMQDSVALFHATHGNLAGSGSVISETSLGAARAAMSRQKDDAGIATGIGVKPKFILVPPELLDLAIKVITAETTPGDAGRPPNAVRNIATPISDGRLTGTAWYIAADSAQTDTIEVTYLNGQREPVMEQRMGWSVDGSEYKVRIDAGVKALHWRGLYKNPGA